MREQQRPRRGRGRDASSRLGSAMLERRPSVSSPNASNTMNTRPIDDQVHADVEQQRRRQRDVAEHGQVELGAERGQHRIAARAAARAR